jgi:hypothetical protein
MFEIVLLFLIIMTIIIRLSEDEINEKARGWNLRLLSDYDEYKNTESVLRWECLKCGHKFHSSIIRINQRKYPCPECGLNKREIPLCDIKKKIRQCSWCKRILPFSKFDSAAAVRREKGGAQSYKSICRKCEKDLKLIRKFKKKRRLISEHFNGKCHNCGVVLTSVLLPSTHFHHPHPKLKSATWHKMRRKKYIEILKWAKRDKVVPLCSNCHLKQQSKIVKLFADLIYKRDIFQKTPEQIDELIDLSIAQNPKTRNLKGYKKWKKKTAIKQWLRKRYIVEQSNDGICIGCGRVNVLNNLPAFVINHLDPSIKESGWLDLHNLDCEQIISILIKEKCIWLCSNCHWISHSIFHKLARYILKDFFPKDYIKMVVHKLQRESNQIITRVHNFKLNIDRNDIRSPLKLEFNQQDLWKPYLLRLYYLTQKLKINHFTINHLVKYIKRSKSNHRKYLKKLLEKEFIAVQRQSGLLNWYNITDPGIQEAKKIENIHKRTSMKIRKIFKIK